MTDVPKPQPPREPDPGDCCGTGCIPCVMDIYAEALEEYEVALARSQASQPQTATENSGRREIA